MGSSKFSSEETQEKCHGANFQFFFGVTILLVSIGSLLIAYNLGQDAILLNEKLDNLLMNGVGLDKDVEIHHSIQKREACSCLPGLNGPIGKRGKKGHSGIPGSQGPPGRPGKSCVSGKVYGIPGVPGLPGRNGERGIPGLTGSPGYLGYPGMKGDKGESVKTYNGLKMEGEFKNFLIKQITPVDYDRVCKHIREHLLHDEITSKMLGVTEDYADEFELLVLAVLGQNMSYLAEEKNTKEVASVRLTFIQKKDESIFTGIQIKTHQTKVILQLFAELDEMANVFERYNISKFINFFAASTNPKYRNLGLAKEMYTRSLKSLKETGVELAKVFTSSPYTKAATLSLGFEEVGRVEYCSMRDQEGNRIFKDEELTPGQCCLVKVFRLQKV